MAQLRTRWMRWLLLGIGGMLLWQAAGYVIDRRSGPNVINQVWIERMPRGERDLIAHLIAIEHDGHRVGSLGRASRWRVASDGFVWENQGDRVAARFPQNDCRLSVQVRAWKCAGQAPAPFDLCLELKGEKRVFRYYSRTDWVVQPHAQLDQQIAWLAPSLHSALALAATDDDQRPEVDPGPGAPASGACADLDWAK